MDIADIRFAKRHEGITGSAIRDIFKYLGVPGMISFAGGNPAPEALPNEAVAELSRELLLSDGKTILQYGATEGYPKFREALPPYLKEHLNIPADASEVLPVTGSTQAMDLLCRSLIDPGDVILTENPTFLGNMQCMRLYQARLVGIESDENGMKTDALEEAVRREKPKMIYIIPTFQNPTGRTLSLERRKKIAEIAEKYGVLVAEDDPYRDLRYSGEALPTIKSFDQSGWVAYMGSFSKVISPGLRVGYLCCEKRLMRKCVISKQSSDLHTANLNQAIAAAYLSRNLLAPHIAEICTGYSVQLSAMLRALSGIGGIARYTRPEGGLFVFAELEEGLSAVELFPKAIEHKVAYVPGTHFYVDGGHENTLRLNFSSSTPETIMKGMEILSDVIESMRRK